MRKGYVLFLLLLSFYAKSQVSLTNGSPSAVIDFSNTTPITVGTNPTSAFSGAGFEPNPATAGRLNSNAWATTGFSDGSLAFGGTNTAGDHARGATAVTVITGGIYAYTGLPGSVADPALMIQPAGSDFTPGTITLRIQNNGTTNLTQLAVSYNIYVNNDQAWSNSFNFSYSTDDITYTPIGAMDYSSTEVADAFGWVLVGTAPSRNTSMTGLTVVPGGYFYIRWTGNDVSGSGSRDEFGLDDINLTATYAPANTITTGLVSTPPFVLANCAATASGTVDFTATDVFTIGNVFTAQLSDDIGSFSAPVTIGTLALDGLDPAGTINITIPAGTPSGTGYRIRVISDNPVVTGTQSSSFTIIQNGIGGCVSSHTDYYRSNATGTWATPATWESSPDNTNWITATLAPTYLANTITIRNPHTVTVAGAASADQVIVQNGGILEHSAGTFTIEDGTGSDVDIESDGVLLLSGIATSPSFAAGSPTINNQGGGIIRVSATGLTGAGSGVNLSNYVYNHNSILEFTLTTTPFSTSNVTYFPNANAATIPIFRVTGVIVPNAGSAAQTTFNGIFECNGAAIFQSAGTKTFRNGIRGTGSISAIAGTGKFVINGTTAELGGTGSLTVPPINGLEIGSVTGTTVTVTNNKTITGDVFLINTSYTELGANNLTVTGAITGGSATSYIRTNGAGVLTLTGIDVPAETFPIGNTSYNPLVISNGSLSDFSARVATGINDPNGAIPVDAVERTWYIGASVVTPGVSVVYQYADANCSPGALPQPQNMELLQSDYTTWHLVAGNTSIAPGGADPAWTIATAAALTINNSLVPYALGVTGTQILSVDYFITAKAQKLNNTSVISWTVASTDNVNSFEVQRSAGNSSYQTIGTVYVVNGQLQYSFTDLSPVDGTNLYRIKVNRAAGGVRYSNTVAVINGSKGILITGVAPNPASDKTTLTISAAKKGAVSFEIYNLSGTVIKRWTAMMTEGTNTVTIQTGGLSAGVYHIVAIGQEARSATRFVKQ